MQKELRIAFGGDILKSIIKNNNECHIEVEKHRAKEVCTYLNSQGGFPLILMFAADERSISGKYRIYYVFADRAKGNLFILTVPIDPEEMEIQSIAEGIPGAASYEREINDLFGIYPMGHPDLKKMVYHSNWPRGEYPLRKDFALNRKPPTAKETVNFKKVEGEGVYEIPVGPVHAGIIEPGHFRFSVAGEPIINLEAQLYFVHKGIEKMSEGCSIEKCLYISERISGDETFANSLAYCQAIEKIAGLVVPERAKFSRVLFAELERLISHLGDLGGICIDTAYGFAAFQFRMLRGWSYLIADELCGMRFLRSVNRPGGIRKDFIEGKEKSLIGRLTEIRAELADTAKIIRSNSMFIDRVENTGVLSPQIARDLNAVGPGGRASGTVFDVRKNYPYEAYDKMDFNVPSYNYGDVNCRMNVKIEECFESIDTILGAIEAMPAGRTFEKMPDLPAYSSAFGLVEAPRGENIHYVMTGEDNTVFRYKVRTPSFCNWPALCHAVRGNTVPDFPLINKSFNLSYAGNDL